MLRRSRLRCHCRKSAILESESELQQAGAVSDHGDALNSDSVLIEDAAGQRSFAMHAELREEVANSVLDVNLDGLSYSHGSVFKTWALIAPPPHF